MTRFALFVDAGYLYAAGGLLCLGTRSRPEVELDESNLHHALSETAATLSGLDHLRTYWYDGAIDGIPTTAHIAVANLRGVKLRLGRLDENGHQKGVDSLIMRDLMRMASEHAIATAYLLSGDEDILQGVIEAQDYGVKVVLVAIRPIESSVSRRLLREADDVLELDSAFLAPHFQRAAPTEDESPVRDVAPLDGRAAPSRWESPQPNTWVPPSKWPDAPVPGPYTVGFEFGDEWLRLATPPEQQRLREQRNASPGYAIPADLDRELLRAARSYVAGGTISQEDKVLLRDGFWGAITGR